MRFLNLLALAVLTFMIVQSCGPGAQREVGAWVLDAGQMLMSDGGPPYQRTDSGSSLAADSGILVDAGRMLVDAGQTLIDAAQRQDASADDPVAASGSRITVRRGRFTGSDGAHYQEYWFRYFDKMLNTECAMYVAADGKQRCLPLSGATVVDRFADANCKTALAIAQAPACNPKYAYELVTAASLALCPPSAPGYRVYRIDAQFSEQQYSLNGMMNCEMVPPIAGYTAFTISPELPPSSFVEFTRADEDVP